ncbi:MAG: MBL fold metallo-hydrolase [Desulfobacterales bacterium]|nr:MBL fold metallo-hydrolase [Desulfobacterales bacterium]
MMSLLTVMKATLIILSTLPAFAQPFETDIVKTSKGDLKITFIGHGSLMLNQAGKIIHIDPFGQLADYDEFPKADALFLTHHHRDHLDPKALQQVRTPDTLVILTEICSKTVQSGIVMKNGDVRTVMGIGVEAVPAYNIKHKRKNGEAYHPEGEGNGYVLTIGDKRVYIAGDTENTLEMKRLENIDVTFLPMNLPYTMTPEMVADVATAFKPKVLYPYHYGETDTSRIVDLLKNDEDIEVRIRRMK